MLVKRILVPIDFSPDSMSALTYAGEFAAMFKAELVLLHVIEPIYYATPTDMYAVSANVTTLLEEQRRMAEEQFKRIGAQLHKKRQRFRALIKTGSPSHVITDMAKRQRGDMIIMATHGRTGLAHMFMGSVAERVVRTAACPVLTVRGAGKARKTSAKKR